MPGPRPIGAQLGIGIQSPGLYIPRNPRNYDPDDDDDADDTTYSENDVRRKKQKRGLIVLMMLFLRTSLIFL